MKLKIIILVFFSSVTTLQGQKLALSIDSVLKGYVDINQFRGQVYVATRGEVVYNQNFVIDNRPAPEIFQLGSITKQFTAFLILKLQEEKKLSVEDKLSKYFPDFPNGNQITIRHLLRHQSGIYNYTDIREFMETEVSKKHNRDQMISLFRDKKSGFAPGEKYAYSNSGYMLLGYIAEQVSGDSYDNLLNRYIFSPLRMQSSGTDFAGLKSDRKAIGYFGISKDSALTAPIVDASVSGAAGNIYSSAEDLYRWANAIIDRNLLKRSSWDSMLSPSLNKYGFGILIDSLHSKKVYHHSGGIHGFNSNLYVFPADSTVIILLSNVNTGVLDDIAQEIAAKVYNIPAAPAVSFTAGQLKEFEGVYQISPQFFLDIRVVNGGLTVQPTNQPRLEMVAETNTRFSLKLVKATIDFQRDSEGKLTGLLLTQSGREVAAKKTE